MEPEETTVEGLVLVGRKKGIAANACDLVRVELELLVNISTPIVNNQDVSKTTTADWSLHELVNTSQQCPQ